jgi:UDP-N-acetylmuramoyl-tripeptide--D-alanyl-D-alanine ligase
MIWFILSLSSWFIFSVLKYKKTIHMFQQNLYNEDHRYIRWIKKNIKKVLLEIDIIIFIILAIISLLTNQYIIMSIYFITYSFLFVLYRDKLSKEQTKKPLVITARVRRLIITISILNLIPVIQFYRIFDINNIIYYYVIMSLMTYLSYLIVFIANIINYPIEKSYFYHFRRKAKKKLYDMKSLKVIGITGSYGKTSSKNILSDILSIKYNTLPTPRNLNTPNGLMITINNHLDKFDDVFIAEMGAYRIGEIKGLCDLVKPQYGILTKIGTAHLESFGSQENIQKAKFELIESLPENGIGVLNGDDELQLNYKLKNKCQILWIGINNKDVDVHASNIKVSSMGTTFDVTFKDDKEVYPFQTRLLGDANVYNILVAIALGKALEVNINELQIAVKKVKAVEHRLELKKYKDVNIIDDAYNSNPIGSKMALEVLNMMPGKKIVVTPGMIELGDKQYELNKKFGEYIADTCDEVILVGEKQTKPIQDGLNEKHYNNDKIHIINDVKLAFKLIEDIKEKDTYVLLENDLPDTFNE